MSSDELSWCYSTLRLIQQLLSVICILVMGNIRCSEPILKDGMFGLGFDILKLLNYRCLEVLSEPVNADFLRDQSEPINFSVNVSKLLKRVSCLFCAVSLDCSGDNMITADSIWYYCALNYISSTDFTNNLEVLLLRRLLDRDSRAYATYGNRLEEELKRCSLEVTSDAHRTLTEELFRDYSNCFESSFERGVKDSFIITNNCFR